MRTRLATISAIIALSASSALACDGFYMGLRGGIINHNIGETGTTNTNRFEVDDNNLMVAGALGYRYGYFRSEVEYIWRDNSETTEGNNNTNFETESYMVNAFLDLTPYSRVTPFIMAGVGLSKISVTFESGGAIPTTEEHEETNFTWAVGGGLSAKLTNRWNMDVGYRFYNMGDIEEASVRAHEIYGGARYVF